MTSRRRGGGVPAPGPARQPVLIHEALVDADLLYQVLEDDEQQRDEPQQHELYRLKEMQHTHDTCSGERSLHAMPPTQQAGDQACVDMMDKTQRACIRR